MRNHFSRTTALLLTCCFSIPLISQVSTVSPYSRYGIGDINLNPFAQNISLGGFSNALQNDSLPPYHINFANPASYTSNRLTTFESGLSYMMLNLRTKSEKEQVNNTSLSYLALAVPVARWWGMGFGLQPYSSVGYTISADDMVDNQKVEYLYKGSGGINRFLWGNAIRPFVAARKGSFAYPLRNLSAGANLSYLFGKIDNTREVIFPVNSQYFNVRSSRSVNVKDIYMEYGIMYGFLIDSIRTDSIHKRDLKDDVKFTFGLTFSPSSDIKAESDLFSTSFIKNSFNYEIIKDTLENKIDKTGAITFPLSIGAGFSFRKGEKWMAGVDVSLQKWSEFYFLGEKGNLRNSMRVSAGLQYIPDKKNETDYFSRVQYRMGMRYQQTYLDLKNTQLNEYAFSIGAGFPTRWFLGQMTMMNISVEAGTRGTTDQGLIREDFLRATLGITFNAKWFEKRKYD